jgi:hypothetical protein
MQTDIRLSHVEGFGRLAQVMIRVHACMKSYVPDQKDKKVLQ